MHLSSGPAGCHVNPFIKWDKGGTLRLFWFITRILFPPGVQRDQAKGLVLWLLLACESLSQFSHSADAPAGWREQRSSGVCASHRPPPCQNQANPFRECLHCKSAMHVWWDAATAPASSAEASILLALLLSSECCWSGGPRILWGPSWPPAQGRRQALCLAACV